VLNLDYEIRVRNISDPVSLWFFGDQHDGSIACADGEMVDTMAKIDGDPDSYVVLMGDSCDFVNVSDPRFDPAQIHPDLRDHLDDLPRESVKRFVRRFDRFPGLKKRTVCKIPGNHDDKIRLKYHSDVAKDICEMLGIPLLATVSQLRLRVTDGKHHSYMVKGVLSHAEKGATTAAGKLAASERMADYYGTHDFFAQAHTHEYLVFDGRNMDVAGDFKHGESPRTVERPRLTFLTGGYLKTYAPGKAGYGERRGYRPCRLGSPRLVMRMKRGKTDEVELQGI
jgi:hypothetical protein